MKEYIKKFESAASANNYEITDIPFTSTVSGATHQNVRCNQENKKIEVDGQGNISVVDAGPVLPHSDEIWYTSSDGNIVTPYQASSLPTIVSNTYVDGKGVIKFATNVTSIGEWAFYGCWGLTSIEIPNSVTSIGYMVFSDCSSLTSVAIPNSVINIGSDAFYMGESDSYSGCGSLQTITVGEIGYEYDGAEFFTITLGNGTNVELTMWINNYEQYCIVKDSPITLSDGTTKMIQDIDYSDELLVWDFDNAQYSSAKPLWIKVVEKSKTHWLCKLENGTEIKLVGSNGKSHRLFNYTDQVFEYPQDCIGKDIYTENGISKLVSCKCINDEIEYYNIITYYHMNLFANSILTSCRYNNIYVIKDMKFVKDNRNIVDFAEYNNSIPYEYYVGMRLGEQTIPIKDTIEYIQIRISKEK